jgi:HD-GYP domain-containing protein (c-di-GMP phosphodiesterase class II)
MASEDLTWFKMGAFLHDLGKVLLPPDILNKPGPLTGEERAVMETHPAEGERLLEEIEFPWDIRPMVRHHHEHWAGTGYPDGLSGTDIPLSARVLTIADVFDALTTERSYRPAFTLEKALEIMKEDSGRIFDPYLFSIFCNLVVGEGPVDFSGEGQSSAPHPPQGSWASEPGGWTRKVRRPRQHSWTSEYPDGLFGHKPDRLSEMH